MMPVDGVWLPVHLLQTDSYKFSESGIYYAPRTGSLQAYKDYIRTLPFIESPEVFGLHENADISSAMLETQLLLATSLSLQVFDRAITHSRLNTQAHTDARLRSVWFVFVLPPVPSLPALSCHVSVHSLAQSGHVWCMFPVTCLAAQVLRWRRQELG